jgi:hypothetical protein
MAKAFRIPRKMIIPGSSHNPVEMVNNLKAFKTASEVEPFFLSSTTSDPQKGVGVVEESPYCLDRYGIYPDVSAELRTSFKGSQKRTADTWIL